MRGWLQTTTFIWWKIAPKKSARCGCSRFCRMKLKGKRTALIGQWFLQVLHFGSPSHLGSHNRSFCRHPNWKKHLLIHCVCVSEIRVNRNIPWLLFPNTCFPRNFLFFIVGQREKASLNEGKPKQAFQPDKGINCTPNTMNGTWVFPLTENFP